MGVAALNVTCKITFSRRRIIRNGKMLTLAGGPAENRLRANNGMPCIEVSAFNFQLTCKKRKLIWTENLFLR
jgi:hypothetical protein